MSDDPLSQGFEISSDGTAADADKRRQFDKLPPERIHELIQELDEDNVRLQKENEMFEDYIIHQRINERLGTDEPSKDEYARGHRLKLDGPKRRQAKKQMVLRKLTTASKLEICKHEYLELQRARDIGNQKFEDEMAKKRAEMEEAQKGKQDVILDRKKFHREVEEKGVNPIPGHGQTIMSEKIVRYYDEKSKAQDNLKAKLLLKNQALRASNKKEQAKLQEKEEKNEVLQQIDFGQLDIENKQYLAKIDERNQELLRLKQLAANTTHTLNRHKNDLTMLTQKSSRLKEEIKSREGTLKKILGETEKVNTEMDTYRTSNLKLKTQQEEYIVPEVLTYVKQNDEEYVLGKTVKDWERKVEIAEMAVKRARTLAAQARRQMAQEGSLPTRGTQRSRGRA